MTAAVPGSVVGGIARYRHLTDGVLDLVLEEWRPADPAKGHCPAYHFAVRFAGASEKIGEVRLRVGRVEQYPGLLTAGHIGYGISEPQRGHGYAVEACRLVRPLARAEGFDELVITCQPNNVASRRTLENLGAVLVGTFDVPPEHEMYKDGRRKVLRFVWGLGGR